MQSCAYVVANAATTGCNEHPLDKEEASILQQYAKASV